MNVLAADKLMLKPRVYSTFLLWLLSELYSTLPEVGDMELPKLVFFFDEAHMLFEGTGKALTDKIEQVIRLIRSKGVGVYFITQSPTDIPESILGQLGEAALGVAPIQMQIFGQFRRRTIRMLSYINDKIYQPEAQTQFL